MFAGNGAPSADGFGKDFSQCVLDSLHFSGIAFIGEEGGMQVPVTHVPEDSDLELILGRDVLNRGNHGS